MKNKVSFVPRRLGYLFCSTILLIGSGSIVKAGIIVDSWQLDTGVVYSPPPPGMSSQDTDSFVTVQNPFTSNDALSETFIGSNTNRTAYDFTWSDSFGAFNVDIRHHIETAKILTFSEGRIFLTPDMDLNLNIDASLNYTSSAADLADIRLSLNVYDVTHDDGLYAQSRRGGTLTLQPANGTLNLSTTEVLEAGNQYQLSYSVQATNMFVANPQGPVDTDGYIHMTLTPVPEPATLGLLCAGAVLVRRQRIRHSR